MNYSRILFISLIFLLLHNVSLLLNADEIPESTPISTYEEDLTGDNLNEIIKLKGSLFSGEGNYYQDIWVELTSKHLERWRIPFKGGYEPELYFFDLNHDHINDLFYQSRKDGSKKLYSQHLYTLKNNKIKEIPLPKQNYIKGNFNDNFQIQIQVSTKINSNPIIIDVEDRAKNYIKHGIYNKKGKLLKPSTVMIAPIAYYEPTLISKSKGYGLKSFQQISGVAPDDKLGNIETLWYYENGGWIILQTDWISS